jgi:hypothetical protein
MFKKLTIFIVILIFSLVVYIKINLSQKISIPELIITADKDLD